MTTSDNKIIQWSMPLTSWAYWYEGMNEPPALELQFIDSSLRRKLSPLAKQVLSIAHRCASAYPGCRIIFASRNGDISRTTTQLLQMLEGETPSPTSFSMSVLNATVGAYSIATSNHAPNTAIAACACSLGFGLLEAHMQMLNQPATPILFIYADEPPPAIYQTSDTNMPAHAVAMLFNVLSTDTLACRITPDTEEDSQQAQSMALIDCLRHGSASWQGEFRRWEWQLNEKQA